MNPQWRPLPTPGMAPAPQSMGGSLPTPDFAPMPMQNPRIAQYTKLMQQADPGQRQQLISHLVDQFNQGNQSVAPYLQDLQAKGLLDQKGLQAQSSAPIHPYAPGPIQALGNLGYRGVNALAEGATSVLPNQTAGEVMDASGRPDTAQSGHAAANADLARTAIADRLMFAKGLPGLTGREAPVFGNFAQRSLQRTLQTAPQLMAGAGVQSFNNQGQSISPGEQFNKTVENVGGGLGFAALGGLGGEVVSGLKQMRQGMVADPRIQTVLNHYNANPAGAQGGTTHLDGEVGYTPGTTLVPDKNGNWVPKVDQPRDTAGRYGNVTKSTPKPGNRDVSNLPEFNEKDPESVKLHLTSVANDLSIYKPAYDEALQRVGNNKVAIQNLQEGLGRHVAELTNDFNYLRQLAAEHGITEPAITPEKNALSKLASIFGRRRSGSLELNGDVTGEPKSLHLDEPTPYESVDISDRKSVGSAVGKTQAYLKRIDQALAQDPTNAPLRQRRLQLANELKQLQSAYRNPVSGENMSELDQWAGMTPEKKAEVEAQKNQFLNDTADASQTTPKLTQEERQKIIDSEPRQQTTNQVSMKVEEGNTKGAIAKATGVAKEADDRLTEAQKAGRKLDDHDTKLLYRVENGEDVKTVAKDAHSRSNFKDAVTKLQDSFDYALAGLRAAGSKTFKQHDYIIPHYYKATAEKMDELGINPEDRVTIKGQSGFHDKSAKYDSYIKAEAAGLHPLFDNPMDAVNQYRQGAVSYIRKQGLHEALKYSNPNDVADLGYSRDNQGRDFTQAAGHLPFNVTDEVNEALKNFRSTKISNPAFRIAYASARAVNSIQKAILFFGAPFHYMNITKNFLGLTTSTGHELLAAQGVKDALLSSFTPGGHAREIAEARASGNLAVAREKYGMSINDDHAPYRPDTLMGNIKRGLDKINILGMTHRHMNNFIDIYGLKLVEAAEATGKVTPEMAIQLGHEFDMVLGRINAAVQGHNPYISKLMGDAGLAPMFTRSQLGIARDAVTKSNPIDITVKGHTLLEKGTAKHGLGITNAGDVARSTVLGTRALEAAVAITGSAVIAGHMPTFHQLLAEAGLLPNNPVPNIDLQHKNKSGHNQVMNLPTDPSGLVAGLVSDPKHFGNARLSPTLSFINRVTTNTDWNGNELVDKSKPGWQTKLLVEAAKGGLPIGVQNLMGATSGKLTTGQAIAQEFGGRVKTDPNDPGVQSGAAYYKNQDKARNALGTNDQAAWDTIFPKTKMADGSYTQAANFNPFKAADKVYTLLSHPQVLDQAIKANQATPGHDPMWDLPKDQLTTFLTYQGIQGTDYGIATAKEIEATNPWIADLNQQRSDWFNTLPKSQNPDGANPIAYPKLDDQTQALMNLESQLTKIPANQRNAWQTEQLNQLYNNPQLKAAYDQLNQYTQDRRAQQNVPQFAQAPVVTPYVQAQMNAGNFRDPYVQSYLNANTAFKASGPFGDGIGGAGGNHNTSAIALANLAQGLTASGKPGAYASSSSSSRNSAARRNLKNEFKYAIKDVKYAGKKMKNNLKYQHHVAGTQLPRLQNQPILTAQQHAARNHAIAKAKNASKRHIA